MNSTCVAKDKLLQSMRAGQQGARGGRRGGPGGRRGGRGAGGGGRVERGGARVRPPSHAGAGAGGRQQPSLAGRCARPPPCPWAAAWSCRRLAAPCFGTAARIKPGGRLGCSRCLSWLRGGCTRRPVDAGLARRVSVGARRREGLTWFPRAKGFSRSLTASGFQLDPPAPRVSGCP